MQATTLARSLAALLVECCALLAALSFASASSRTYASDTTDRDIVMHRRLLLMSRAADIRPQHRFEPLRVENISDDEVREVQGAASDIVGNVLVQIGGVTTGCPCEDGSRCTDQVWVQTEVHKKPFGFVVSKIDGHWKIGPVQRWWWHYEGSKYDERFTLLDELSDCAISNKMADYYRTYHIPAARQVERSR